MADINPLDPNAAQLMDLSQQRKLADLLTQQGLQQPQGQMVSGQYVKASPLQYFANLANLYAGQKTGEQATQKASEYASALRQQGGIEVQDILETYKTDPNAALKKASMAVSPEAKSLATQLSKVAINEPTTDVQNFLYGQKNPQFGQYQEVQANLKAPRTSIINSMPPAESAYSTEMGKGAAKQDLTLKDIAEGSTKTIENIHNQRKLLDTGKVITGFGADQRLGLAQFGKAVGLTGKGDEDLASNTQNFLAGRAGSTLDAIQSSNLGSAQGFSNTDREFLQAAKLGGIKYDEKSLRRQLDLEEKVARAGTEKWNQRVKSMPKSASMPINLSPVELPNEYQMPGVDKSNPLLR